LKSCQSRDVFYVLCSSVFLFEKGMDLPLLIMKSVIQNSIRETVYLGGGATYQSCIKTRPWNLLKSLKNYNQGHLDKKNLDALKGS